MHADKDITYSDAIEQIMLNNGSFAPLTLLYEQIWHYKDKSKIKGKTPHLTIQEKVQRDPRFTRIARGVYALTDFIEKVEKENLGYFTTNENEEVIFRENPTVEDRQFEHTEGLTYTSVRLAQSHFRNKLMKEMDRCPITGIDEPKLLIASHIKPWAHSNNKERVDSKNGILLSPLFDKLFDKGVGLITFTLDKKILISGRLSKENIRKLNISPNQTIKNLPIAGREEYLEYHRRHIFQG